MTSKKHDIYNAKPGLFDYAALMILKLAKKRKKAKQEPFYETFFEDYHVEQYEKDIRMILKHGEIKKALTNINNIQTCADIGCGVGHILKLFPIKSKKIGIDYSFRSLRIARRNLNKDYSFIQSSALQLPLASSSIDVLTCFEVLEHLPNDDEAIKEMYRVIRPSGFLIISVPNHFYFSDYEKLMGHFRHYSHSEIESLLSGKGFSVCKLLNMYPVTSRCYFPVYVLLEALNIAINKITRDSSTIYNRKCLFTSKNIYNTLIQPFFLKLARLEAKNNDSKLAETTFIMAQKIDKECND